MGKRKQKKPKREPRERREPRLRGILQMFEVDPGPWVCWLLVIAAVGWLIWANGEAVEGQKTLNWRETAGTVVETGVSKTTSGGSSGNPTRAGGGATSSSSSWHVGVSYRYEVDGHAYSGSRIVWEGGSWTYDNADEAHAKKRELTARPTIPVFYDPVRPSQAVLVRGGNLGKPLVGVLMVGGAVGLLIYSYMRQRPVRKDLPPKKRRWPLVKRALLGGFAATVVVGGLQYLYYLRVFA